MTRCAVIGAGAWGTALADVLARNGHDVRLWALEGDVVAGVNASHENVRFLPGFRLADSLRATSAIADAVGGAALVCIATATEVRLFSRGSPPPDTSLQVTPPSVDL